MLPMFFSNDVNCTKFVLLMLYRCNMPSGWSIDKLVTLLNNDTCIYSLQFIEMQHLQFVFINNLECYGVFSLDDAVFGRKFIYFIAQ